MKYKNVFSRAHFGKREIMEQENRKTPYEVIEEIEVLREFAFGITADIDRLIDAESQDSKVIKLLENMNSEIEYIYSNIFKIHSLKDAYICRGKLQMVNQLAKEYKKTQGK